MSKKRSICIRWDDYFMGTALLAARRQKDSDDHLQGGTCIVSPDGKIVVGVGHHTIVKGFDFDLSEPDYWCHAITNAIMWANKHDLHNCIIYSVTYPCNKCAQLIIQSRIGRVHYMTERQCCGKEQPFSQKLLNEAGIPCRKYLPEEDIKIDFERMDPTLFGSVDSKL